MKRLRVLISLTALLLCLTGCHGSRGLKPFAVPEAQDTETPVEITFWAKNDTNKTQTRIYEQAIQDFESLYPNITVNMRLYTDYGKIYNDVITNIFTGTTPDVCITYPDHIATYMTGSNVVVPLDELAQDPQFGLGGSQVRFDAPKMSEMVPEFLEECRVGGQLMAMPYMRSTEACYVNADMVEKLGYTLPEPGEPLTWDFVWEVSEAAMAKNADGTYAVNGQQVLIPFIYKSTDNMMIQLLRQMGGGYSTPEGEILIFNDTTRQILETVASHVKNGACSTFKISSYPGNFLNAGQCIFAVDSTAGATWMGTGAPNMDISADRVASFETRVYPVPQMDPAHPQMISQGHSVCIFNKRDPQEVLASWLFVQFLLSDRVQIAYAKTEGYVPVTQKARDTQDYRTYLSEELYDTDAEHYSVKLDATRMFLSHTSDTFVTPVFPGSASLRDAAGQMIENVSKSTRRKETVDDAYYERLYRETASLYRLDQGGAETKDPDGGQPLPAASAALLWTLGLAWLLIGIWCLLPLLKERGKPRK
ncbi:MAG: extracellular solute-binding protein [Lachnospiraceae bacterium]|nr:extracellular solute-binding protein [Lachnospiraceae bacterium]